MTPFSQLLSRRSALAAPATGALLGVILCGLPGALAAQTHDHASRNHTSPYAGHENREIAALSSEEIEGLLAGEGMGMALPAELNGYPGPKHVLEMAADLNLSSDQRSRVEAVFAEMQATAREQGARLVALERELDQAFKDRTVTGEHLALLLSSIAGERAQLRATHLSAHLRLIPVLSPEQVETYKRIRGYGGTP